MQQEYALPGGFPIHHEHLHETKMLLLTFTKTNSLNLTCLIFYCIYTLTHFFITLHTVIAITRFIITIFFESLYHIRERTRTSSTSTSGKKSRRISESSGKEGKEEVKEEKKKKQGGTVKKKGGCFIRCF